MTGRLVGMIAAGVGIVVVVAVLLRGGEAPSAGSAGSAGSPGTSADSPAGPSLGVRADDIDSARRSAEDRAALRSTPPERAARGERPESSDISRGTREPREAPPGGVVAPAPVEPPPPAIAPSAAAVAESEASLAAQPTVLAAVEAALANRRAQIRARCWTGAQPASASLPIEVSYGGDGTLLALSVSDDAAAPGLGQCVRGETGLVPTTIAAPGVGVTVKTALRLP